MSVQERCLVLPAVVQPLQGLTCSCPECSCMSSLGHCTYMRWHCVLQGIVSCFSLWCWGQRWSWFNLGCTYSLVQQLARIDNGQLDQNKRKRLLNLASVKTGVVAMLVQWRCSEQCSSMYVLNNASKVVVAVFVVVMTPTCTYSSVHEQENKSRHRKIVTSQSCQHMAIWLD